MVLFSALNSISDPVLYYLANGVLIINALVILLLIQVIIIRIYGVYQHRSNDIGRKIWRPILAEMMQAYPENIPKLQHKHRHVFLHEWNKFYFMLRGETADRLQKLSRQQGLDIIAKKYVQNKNMQKKLLGIITLGHMQEYSIWNKLIDFTHSEHSILSLTAAQALVDIDSKSAVAYLMPHIIKRRDWPLARVAMMLNSADSTQLTTTLSKTIEKASINDIPHILKFLSSSHFDPKISKLCKRLSNSDDNRIISTCIKIAKDEYGLILAREHANSSEWHIRLHVATALGRMGLQEDVKILIKLMSDTEWWVRYRSAQSLAQMPFIHLTDLKQIRNKLQDRYARDILQQVISEQALN
ncbi:hypothetical protein MNBD_GAMMA06-1031 [hydrothermal vent metagenome]|uniref:HEAT repeat domain-containing protein n=1 Tax=hydrothermal vent metagenome TaxID=652676 RepID=A0A3B0WHC7_9ZZZZ